MLLVIDLSLILPNTSFWIYSIPKESKYTDDFYQQMMKANVFHIISSFCSFDSFPQNFHEKLSLKAMVIWEEIHYLGIFQI